MLKNYIKIACRNLLKNKIFSFINILGLSFSVAFCLLLFFYIRYEQSFDKFHLKKNQLFRLEMTSMWQNPLEKKEKDFFSILTKDDDQKYDPIFPLVVATDMQNNFPEIKSISRIKDVGEFLIKANDEVYKEGHTLYADDNFFQNFSFRLKKGNPKTVLKSPKNAVLSVSVAKKFFENEENAIGRTIELTGFGN